MESNCNVDQTSPMSMIQFGEDEEIAENARNLDLSYCDIRTLELESLRININFRPELVRKLTLYGNSLLVVPLCISEFCHLQELDVSSNQISWISGEVSKIRPLKVLEARDNRLHNLPKEFSECRSLKVLNLSGNNYTDFPPQIFDLKELKELYFGGNKLFHVPPQIKNLKKLELLYVGGNEITHVSTQMRKLKSLQHLFLCDNKLDNIPPELGQLKKLESLSLHKNNLKTLPIEIVMLTNLQELSLRDNPLVDTFVKKLEFSPPSLLELAGRVIKTKNINYRSVLLPKCLRLYLDSARRCVNPNCDGVYFDSGVKCVKFVDFCGKFRVPLEQYLCSPFENVHSLCESNGSGKMMRKVLLPPAVVDSD